MTSTRRDFKQRLRATLYGEQNGLCFWCKDPMVLLARYPDGGGVADNICTIDHERSWNNVRLRDVAACYGCNRDRDHARHRSGQHLREGIAA